MTLYQFKLLRERDQYNTIWEKGILVDARITEQYKFLLYRVETFYVEIQYSCGSNKIMGLECFVDLSTDYLNLN